MNNCRLEKITGVWPNLKEYYHAAQIDPILSLCDKNYEAKWKNTECLLQGRELSSIIGELETIRDVLKHVNTVTRLTLEVWLYVVRKHKLERELCLLKWPAYTNSFTPNAYDSRFKQWINNGITALCLLVKDGNFKRFQELKQEFDLTNCDHF